MATHRRGLIDPMQSHYPASFERDMGCTQAEWLGWLPAALGERRWRLQGASAQVDIDAGHLVLEWREQAPRTIALMRIPRLSVSFRFEGVSEEIRHRFMKRFDLYMQRGGG